MNQSQPIEHILVFKEKHSKRTVLLESATCSIGRDPSNSIVLDSPRISRNHAILLRLTIPESAHHKFRLIDGDFQGKRSRNGFKVNSHRCLSHDLEHGDEICFGEDIVAKYYAVANQADLKFLTSDHAEDMSAFLSNLNDPFINIITENVPNRNLIERTLERLASFPELLSNPVIEIDLFDNITYLNPAALKEFPNLREIKLQHPLLTDIVALVQANQTTSFVREVEVEEKIFEQSIHYISASGLIRCYITDITQRKQAEAALQWSEQRFRLLSESSPVGIFQADVEGLCLYINSRWSEISGLTLEDSLGDGWKKAIHPKDYESVCAEWHKCVEERQDFAMEFRCLTPEEKVNWVNARAAVLRSDEGEVIGYVGTYEDITQRKQVHYELEKRVKQRTAELDWSNQSLKAEIAERKRAEAALHSSMATNRALLNAIPDWMFRITQDGTLVNFKAPKSTNLPLSSSNFLGKKIYEVLPKEIAEAVMDGMMRAFESKEVQICEYQLLVHQKMVDYEARIAISSDREFMVIIRDITESKRKEQDIRNALQKEKHLNELKSRFVAMTSHEFRTPLASILSSAELLEHYGHKWDEDRKLNHLKRIQISVKHMTELLNDVLLLAKQKRAN
jgi:PAS domain S-box-containing protein